jgi:hypothetical protein
VIRPKWLRVPEVQFAFIVRHYVDSQPRLLRGGCHQVVVMFVTRVTGFDHVSSWNDDTQVGPDALLEEQKSE